jgi:hypothetical protein
MAEAWGRVRESGVEKHLLCGKSWEAHDDTAICSELIWVWKQTGILETKRKTAGLAAIAHVDVDTLAPWSIKSIVHSALFFMSFFEWAAQ